jgi:hypothetical protein
MRHELGTEADNAHEATLRHLPKMHCIGSAGE